MNAIYNIFRKLFGNFTACICVVSVNDLICFVNKACKFITNGKEVINMEKKIKILVACGSGIATSGVAAEVVKSICKKEKINADISKCAMSEISSLIDNVDILLTTSKYRSPINKPCMSVFGLISGINEDKISADLVKLLCEIEREKQ
jgi:PTS system galactitol-specific IIB component